MIEGIPMRTGSALAATLLLLSACGDGEPSVPALPEAIPLLSEERTYADLEYSPDGSRVAYAATEAGVPVIWVANADGSDPVALTTPPGASNNPEWSPDGSWIAFVTDELGPPDIMVVPAEGGEPRALTQGQWLDNYPKPSPDGSEILFYGNRNGTVDLWTVPVDGGEARVLTSAPGDDFNQDWSPDGRWIAFTRGVAGRQTVWLYSLADSTERGVTSEGFENYIGNSWSPDSREFLYVSTRTGSPDIWAYSLETGESRQVTSDIRSDVNATYSPDGRWVAFRSGRGGQDDVWIVPASGGDAIRITDDAAEEYDLRWRPDGRGLTYVQDDNVSHAYALDLATGTTRQITRGDDDRGIGDMSPDGTQIVGFVELGANADLHVVSASGGDSRPLVSSPVDDFRARWSPDGATVAFGSNRGGETNIYLVAAGGGPESRLTAMPSTSWEWSPSGDRIAFTAPGPDGTPHLWVVPVEGGEPTRISDLSQVLDLSWHPDGESFLAEAGPAGTQTIHRVSIDGGAPVRVGPPGVAAGAPEWSPDGTRFVFHAFDGEQREAGFDVFVADADGTGLVRLTDGPTFDVLPFWSADGETIYYQASPGPAGGFALAAVPAAGGESRWLLDNADDNTFVRRDPGTGELFYTRRPLSNRYVTVDIGELLDRAGGG